jgi:sigma-B regulation protein RsbU (phosphoserine phosphatase)
MRFPALLLLITGMFLDAATARGQTADFSASRVAMTELAGPWRFHASDDAAWASPGFDDSGWSLLKAGTPWSAQGYKGYSGVGWYRLRVVHTPQTGALGFYLLYEEESCQVFANGRLIGEIGGLPPDAHYVFALRTFFKIPADAVAADGSVEIAIRMWHSEGINPNGGGLLTVPMLGTAGRTAQWRQLELHDAFAREGARFAELYDNILTALAGLSLFVLRRKEREYLWWGLSQLCYAGIFAMSFYLYSRALPYFAFLWIYTVVYVMASYFELEFYAAFLRQGRDWLFWMAAAFLVICQVSNVLGVLEPGWGGARMMVSFSGMLSRVCIVGMLWRRSGKEHRDATILLVSNAVSAFFGVVFALDTIPFLAQIGWFNRFAGFLRVPIHWPFTVYGGNLIGDFIMFSVLVILVRRFARSRRDEERLEQELEAARAVQKVLIPNEVPSIAGFAVETVYQPAAQVGGDFFQIIPLAGGGALIAIGDVSGKGMPAAMTVSLLVGTLRTLAYYTQSPGEILSAMNRRMLARSQGGFTTCLVMRLDVDGTLRAANAGHIAPYLDGREVEIENGLPLGLAETAEYRETTIRMHEEDRLTLLTDGVVEARNAQGELLGFERTRELSRRPAEDVAKAAQSFGQEDDITVLSLCMACSREAA